MNDPTKLPSTMPSVIVISSLGSQTALTLVRRALDEAAYHQWRIAVAVADANGAILASARMDGVAPPILEFAFDKAFTAATMRRTTAAFAERMDSSPGLRLGLATRERLLTWAGGLPIIHDGQVIGAIGISGARDHEDVACAEATLAAEGLAWEA
ncbi:GlcG/HbpS family heme-binding protein [Rubellimicrobium roseum]|uniref:Heme-binding protein n=1 Tax=Rubellimicrobium roseum TaxID=687525 RepID=A0A5C4NF18_9RHOB|nr:heme-binding protein [Rubellimicrobium roseum]TNC72762.1 heme-binding protein [Rubellimicrobium roseum]